MYTLAIFLHIIICAGLIIVVLMQSSKGEGLAGAFGGGGGMSGAVFGGRGAASFLSKATTVLAVLFMISCISLTFLSRGGSTSEATGTSAVEKLAGQQQPTQAPVPSQSIPQTTPSSTDQGNQPTTNPSTTPATKPATNPATTPATTPAKKAGGK